MKTTSNLSRSIKVAADDSGKYKSRLVGRLLAEDVADGAGEVIATRNTEVDPPLSARIEQAGIAQVQVRSPPPVRQPARSAVSATAGLWPTTNWWTWVKPLASSRPNPLVSRVLSSPCAPSTPVVCQPLKPVWSAPWWKAALNLVPRPRFVPAPLTGWRPSWLRPISP